MGSVALVASGDPPGHPLAPRLRDLSERGFEANLVLVGRDPGPVAREALPDGCLRRARRPHALRTLLSELDPDVVHFCSLEVAATWLPCVVGGRAAVAVSLCGDDLDSERIDHPETLTRVCEQADGLHFETDALVTFGTWLGIPARETVVVGPVAAPRRILAEPPDTGFPLRIVSGGPVGWMRGLEYALHAVKLLADQGVACSYTILGHSEFVDALALARHQLGLDASVVFASDLPVADALDDAAVLLNASVVPSSPRVGLEALARGLSVVTTEPIQGLADETLLVPRRDPPALASALHRLVTDPRPTERRHQAAARVRAHSEAPDRLAGFAGLYHRITTA
jgi:glycosyltransferase involved in cell wall biosynthesis